MDPFVSPYAMHQEHHECRSTGKSFRVEAGHFELELVAEDVGGNRLTKDAVLSTAGDQP